MTAENLAGYVNPAPVPADDRIVVSFKGDGAYDAPLIAIKGREIGEVATLVAQVFGLQRDNFANLEELVVEASVGMKALHTAKKGLTPQQAPAAPQSVAQGQVVQGPWGGAASAPAAQPAPPVQHATAPGAKVCAHGPRQYVHLRNKNLHAYFCPLGKGDPNACKPVFEEA